MNEMLEQTLLNMGIYELRNYAREVGVTSPTTLKRQQLIDAIIAIKTGTVKPVKGLTRGRKPKNKEKINLNKFIPPELVPYDMSNNFSTFQVASPATAFEKNSYFGSGFGVLLTGELEQGENGNFVMYSQNYEVQINKELIENTNFKVGEIVQVNCDRTTEENKLVATNVFESKKLLVAFNELEVIEKNRNLSFKTSAMPLKTFIEKHRLMAGQSVLVTYEKEINPEFVVNEIAKALKNNNDCRVALISTQLKTAFVKENFEHIFEISALSDVFERVKIIEQAINQAKRVVEIGSNCILFVGNLSAIYNAYFQVNLSQHGNESLAKNNALQKVAEIMALSRQTSKSALTTFAFSQSENLKTDYCQDYVSAEINFEQKDGSYVLNNSYSIYKSV